MSPTVWALVLTHSSPHTLVECVRALQNQTRAPDHILVIDNAGTPPAAAVLDGVDVEVLRLPTNSGPAGGHARGLTEFVARGGDWAWVMDDDIVPDPDCLARLLDRTADADQPRFVWPRIRQRDGAPHDYPGWCGFLVARDVVTAVGYPVADLVWWAEDTEYLQRRIPRAGFEPVTVDAARVMHADARHESTVPPWKIYYQVRNTVYYRAHVQGLNHPVRLTRSLLGSLWAAAVPPGPRAERLRRYGQGLLDGVRGRLGPRVPLPS